LKTGRGSERIRLLVLNLEKLNSRLGLEVVAHLLLYDTTINII
jgi:hypothetical protein